MTPTRRTFLRAAVTGVVAGLAGCAGGDAGATGEGPPDWPHPNFSPTGRSYNPRATGPSTRPTESWGVEIGAFALGRPVVAGDTVYFATAASLRAFDVANGTERWAVDAGSRDGFRTPPTASGGHVYVGETGGRTGVRAVTTDGEEAWHAPTEASVWAPVVRPDPGRDALYTADTDGYVYRIRAEDGTVQWRTRVFGPAVALAARGERPVVGTEGGEVVALVDDGADRGPTGLWRTKLPGGIQSLAVTDGADVVAGAFGAGVARLRGSLRAGSVDWHREASSPHRAVVVGPDRVFATDGSGLHAYDRRSGDRSWVTDGDFFAPPAGAGDAVFVSDTSDDGALVAYDRAGGIGVADARLGNRRWRYPLDGGAATGPTPAHDAVFVVESGGEGAPSRLVALRAE